MPRTSANHRQISSLIQYTYHYNFILTTSWKIIFYIWKNQVKYSLDFPEFGVSVSVHTLHITVCHEFDFILGDNGAASSDNSGDDIPVSMSIPQNALLSHNATQLTNGNSVHSDDTSPKTSKFTKCQMWFQILLLPFFPIWGRHIEFLFSTFSGLVLLVSVLLSPSYRFL